MLHTERKTQIRSSLRQQRELCAVVDFRTGVCEHRNLYLCAAATSARACKDHVRTCRHAWETRCEFVFRTCKPYLECSRLCHNAFAYGDEA